MAKRKQAVSKRKPKASTADVVGAAGPAGAKDVPRQHRARYARLLRIREDLLGRQKGLTKDAKEENRTFSMHMADAATEAYDRDFALSMLSSEQDAVYEVDQALDRIRNGNYGICELTGKKIEPARLDAVPWTRFSAKAERELEREGSERRRHLSPRESVPRERTPPAERPD